MNPWFLCLPPLPRFFRLVLVLANHKFIGCSIFGVNDSGIICWFITFTDVFTCILTIRSTVSILACAPNRNKEYTYTYRLGSVSFQPALPSFLARTLSISSALVSSTTKSTSWLLSDFAELEDEC
jgi:hypothetical protein